MNLNKYTHIIWDWNGTLINDVAPCVDILNNMLTRRNMTRVSMQQYTADFDFPVIDYYRRLGFDFQKESFDDVAEEFISQYYTTQLNCSLHPAAIQTLKKLADKGLKQSILSAFHQDLLEEVIHHFNLTDFFTKIVGLSDYYAASKVENAKTLLKDLAIPAENVLLIGDTSHDHEVAQAINADCLLIAAGHQNRKKLKTCNTWVIDSLTQLPLT